MYETNPKEIARILIQEFGLDGALRYAIRKAAGPCFSLAIAYHEAIPFIEARIEAIKPAFSKEDQEKIDAGYRLDELV